MRTIKQFMFPVFFFLSALGVEAQTSMGNSKFTFEPLYGVETRLVRFPEPARYTTSATYGLRLLYGVTLLSAEGEYTTTKSRNDYPAINQKVEDTSNRVSLGIRTTLPATQYVAVYFRAGGRLSEGETVITTPTETTTNKNPQRIDPYAGAGIQVAFHSNFALNAGATMIRNAENKYDAQYTLGLSGRFGNR